MLYDYQVSILQFFQMNGDPTCDPTCSCQCLKTGRPATFEVFEPHLNMFLEIRAIPRFDSKNQLDGLIHVVRDITKRKEAAKTLRIQANNLSEANFDMNRNNAYKK